MYAVYVLQSQKDNGYYIGVTSDLERRLFEHHNGLTKSVKNRRPLKFVFVENFDNKNEAWAREKHLKSFKGGEGLKKLLKNKLK